MSITLGIYDIFSYLIPGILYLYVISVALELFNVNVINLLPTKIPEAFVIVFGLVLAFIAGHIFDMVARWFVFRLIYRNKTSQAVLEMIKRRDIDANIQFEAKDWHLLLVLLRQRNLAVAQSFDKHEADSIMFRNISLIALLMTVILIIRAVVENPWMWLVAIFTFVVFIMAAKRSHILHSWFFEGVFLASLEYGNTINKVLEYDTRQYLDHSVQFSLGRKSAKDK